MRRNTFSARLWSAEMQNRYSCIVLRRSIISPVSSDDWDSSIRHLKIFQWFNSLRDKERLNREIGTFAEPQTWSSSSLDYGALISRNVGLLLIRQSQPLFDSFSAGIAPASEILVYWSRHVAWVAKVEMQSSAGSRHACTPTSPHPLIIIPPSFLPS